MKNNKGEDAKERVESGGGGRLDFWLKESIKDVKFSDEYVIDRELGRGATSIVYRCRCRRTSKEWAVKMINKKVERRIVATEIGVLLKLNHPNIFNFQFDSKTSPEDNVECVGIKCQIRLKEVYESTAVIHMILELVTGGELFDRIVSCGFYSEKEAIKCVSQMLEAVQYLHNNDIIHRDLKPENLLYEDESDDAKLKIADFGLSKITEHNIQMQTICGTPGYCAPEVLKGHRYDSSVDLWSIGVITYILLCGYEPFYGNTENETFKKILLCQYVFDSPWWDDVTDVAKDFVSRLLLANPSERMTTSQALQHPWLTGKDKVTFKEHLPNVKDKLKDFNAKRKLKAATDVLMALKFRHPHPPNDDVIPSDVHGEDKCVISPAEKEDKDQNEDAGDGDKIDGATGDKNAESCNGDEEEDGGDVDDGGGCCCASTSNQQPRATSPFSAAAKCSSK
ncbi:hypothetical protein HELRODRAFT_194833 [Helobdella robusta]|uniref:Protein kinase domain-containing protein n=1 Tax=Helobdella robusta TaxID=6412 RepID=T1FWG8_HELRO|nr:hypothetical protein HELRODRAFT_194833 [Helobdella robusta]ESO11375.1 hypothetical protein HELRODRAFT_194833 [Helobdella robusta]